MAYSWKGHTDRKGHKNRIKRSAQARLDDVRDINHNIPATWRWACRGPVRKLEPSELTKLSGSSPGRQSTQGTNGDDVLSHTPPYSVKYEGQWSVDIQQEVGAHEGDNRRYPTICQANHQQRHHNANGYWLLWILCFFPLSKELGQKSKKKRLKQKKFKSNCFLV